MRVLFVTWSFNGHYNPLVPLGWALRAAGHDVLVASHPDYAETITKAGLPALPVGKEFDVQADLRQYIDAGSWHSRRATTPQDKATRRHGMEGLMPPLHSAEAMADDLLAFSRSWQPDLVVFEPTAFAGPLVARAIGVPAIRHLWTADFTAPLRKFEDKLLGPLFERYGVTEIGCVGDLTLDPCPPRLQVVDDLPRQRIRYVPYNGPAVLPEWLREPSTKRRVCVTWGTSVVDTGLAHTFLAPRVVEALADFDGEVVVAVADSQREQFPDLPANVRSIGPVPLGLVLPGCAGIVHQGGGGTLMTALSCGVPQLIVPYMPDTSCNAMQLSDTGAGLHLWGEDATVEALRTATSTLLGDESYQVEATRLQEELNTLPAPNEVVGVLENLAHTGKWTELPIAEPASLAHR